MRSEPRTFNPTPAATSRRRSSSASPRRAWCASTAPRSSWSPGWPSRTPARPTALSCTLKLRQGVDVLRRRALHLRRRRSSRSRRPTTRRPAARSATRCLSAASRWPSRRPTRTPSWSTFPSVFGPGLRLLDALPILPKHKLDAAFKAGTLRQQWGPATPPADMVGLGPFVIADVPARPAHRPGAQPEVLAQGRGGRAAAVSRPAHARHHARPERRAAAPAVGAGRSHAERDPARRLRRAQTRGGGREAAPGGRRAWRSTPTRSGST